jgi:hypothetical protein
MWAAAVLLVQRQEHEQEKQKPEAERLMQALLASEQEEPENLFEEIFGLVEATSPTSASSSPPSPASAVLSAEQTSKKLVTLPEPMQVKQRIEVQSSRSAPREVPFATPIRVEKPSLLVRSFDADAEPCVQPPLRMFA